MRGDLKEGNYGVAFGQEGTGEGVGREFAGGERGGGRGFYRAKVAVEEK